MNDEKRPQPLMTDRLSGEERLSRLYHETDTEMPPPGLDAAILDAARQATRQQPRRVYFLTARKWTMTLSLAAALIMTIGIVRTLRHEMSSPALVSQTPAAPRASSTARVDARDETLLNRREQKQGQGQEAPAVAHQPEETLGKTVTPDTKDRLLFSESPWPAPAERQVLRDAPKLQAQEQSQSVPLSPRPPLPPALATESVADQEKANVGSAASLGPQTPVQRQQSQRSERQREEGIASTLHAPQTAVQSTPRSREKTKIEGMKKDELSLDEWIAEIKKLRQAGKLTAAEASLTAFKQRYPEYPVEKALALPLKSHKEEKGAR
jgi:hypothetical protein